jgi:hypothetical protein
VRWPANTQARAFTRNDAHHGDAASTLVYGFVAVTPAAPAAGTIAVVFSASPGQDHHFSADRFGNGIQLGTTYLRFKELQVATLHSDDRKAWPTGSFSHMTALSHKYLSHDHSCLLDFGRLPKTI